MSGRCVTKDRPLGNQKAAEKGIGLEERGTVHGKDVNIGGFGDVLCQATCVLRSDILVCVTKKVRDVFSSGGKWEVGISRKDSAETKNGSNQDEQKG